MKPEVFIACAMSENRVCSGLLVAICHESHRNLALPGSSPHQDIRDRIQLETCLVAYRVMASTVQWSPQHHIDSNCLIACCHGLKARPAGVLSSGLHRRTHACADVEGLMFLLLQVGFLHVCPTRESKFGHVMAESKVIQQTNGCEVASIPEKLRANWWIWWYVFRNT